MIEEENWEDERNDGKHLFGSDSERTSSDQPLTGDYGFVIGDDSATDDEMMFVENTGKLFKKKIFFSYKYIFSLHSPLSKISNIAGESNTPIWTT